MAALMTTPKRSRWLRRTKKLPANSLAIHFGPDDEHTVTYEVAEQMRLLVGRARLNRGISCVGITSTVAGEGSSFIARSLAAVFAHDTDLRVCLVDFDWDKEGEETSTELDVLGIVDEGPEETGVQLTYETSGHVTPLQRSLFATSETLASGMSDLTDWFDLVILDLPPVGDDSSVLSLCEFTERVVLVTAQGVAPAGRVRSVLNDIGRDRIGGVVLNRFQPHAPDWVLGPAGA